MKKLIFFLFSLIFSGSAAAQLKVTFVIEKESILPQDSIYISGDFNKWAINMKNEDYLLVDNSVGQKMITLDLSPGDHEYKFHRGNWAKVEMRLQDSLTIGEAPNRLIKINQDTTIYAEIDEWLDRVKFTPKYLISDYSIKENLFLGNRNIWLYKSGNDNSWKNNGINTTDWQQIKPSEIDLSFANEDGTIEGWFRTTIKIDSNFLSKTLQLKISAWAAIDLYLDGNLIRSFGNTGDNGQPFRENNRIHDTSQEIDVSGGKEYLFALHFVDKLSSIPKREFKGNIIVHIFSKEEFSKYENHLIQEPIFTIIKLSISTLLALLFWLLYFVLPDERHLKLIAAVSTLLLISQISNWIFHSHIASYDVVAVNEYFTFLFYPFSNIISIYLIVKIFNRKITKLLKFFLLMVVAIAIVAFLGFFPNFLGPANFIFCFLILFYYTMTSLKYLKGAQWAVVIGILIMGTLVLVGLIQSIFFENQASYIIVSIIETSSALAFPLSLIVYVAWRFKEIIKEVKVNAQQVVVLSAKQQEQAIMQQKVLEEQVKERTFELSQSLDQLKSTQSQLIHSEKMASLGELTAGIAHEIQNPLNFVNNFSEINVELIEELTDEITKGNYDEVSAIVQNIKENEQKINHHGKRADSIVKGMLQHSRSSNGIKEPTDINKLVDEYLRLSYHGLRAKDKSFNAKIRTEYDEKLGKINVIPQDFGRVILNLFTNAFYAVKEKQEQWRSLHPTNISEYEPMVSVLTKQLDNKVEIRISDNGAGIPKTALDKIFHPFFTTKPTGQGTGLGLSMSYDIVKAHDGLIYVETKTEEDLQSTKLENSELLETGTSFIIELNNL